MLVNKLTAGRLRRGGYHENQKSCAQVFLLLCLNLLVFQVFQVYLGRTIDNYKFRCSWLIKVNMSCRNINEQCRIGND